MQMNVTGRLADNTPVYEAWVDHMLRLIDDSRTGDLVFLRRKESAQNDVAAVMGIVVRESHKNLFVVTCHGVFALRWFLLHHDRDYEILFLFRKLFRPSDNSECVLKRLLKHNRRRYPAFAAAVDEPWRELETGQLEFFDRCFARHVFGGASVLSKSPDRLMDMIDKFYRTCYRGTWNEVECSKKLCRVYIGAQ